MWVFTKTGFVSIVEHRDDPGRLLVRARTARHLRKLFPNHAVEKTPDADYPARVYVSRDELLQWLLKQGQGIDYTNFKSSIPFEELSYSLVCHNVWAAARQLQAKSTIDWEEQRDDPEL